jgi:hypothetical protein
MFDKKITFSDLSFPIERKKIDSDIEITDMHCSDYYLENNEFKHRFHSCSREVGTFREEILKTAKYISTKTKKQIYVLSSGGLDSEIICMALKELQIDFKVISFKFEDVSNLFDISYAMRWCEENKIEHIIKNINLSEFYKKIVPYYQSLGFRGVEVYRYLCCFYMDIVESLNGCAIMGGGTYGLSLNSTNGEAGWYMHADKYMVVDYCKMFKLQHYPLFYIQNSEILQSYFNNKLIKFLMENSYYLAIGNEIEKSIIHHSEWDNDLLYPSQRYVLLQRSKKGGIIEGKRLEYFYKYTTIKLKKQYPESQYPELKSEFISCYKILEQLKR